MSDYFTLENVEPHVRRLYEQRGMPWHDKDPMDELERFAREFIVAARVLHGSIIDFETVAFPGRPGAVIIEGYEEFAFFRKVGEGRYHELVDWYDVSLKEIQKWKERCLLYIERKSLRSSTETRSQNLPPEKDKEFNLYQQYFIELRLLRQEGATLPEELASSLPSTAEAFVAAQLGESKRRLRKLESVEQETEGPAPHGYVKLALLKKFMRPEFDELYRSFNLSDEVIARWSDSASSNEGLIRVHASWQFPSMQR